MTPTKHFTETSVSPGSSHYYSLLFLPEPVRQATTQLYKLNNELHALGQASNEPAVVQAKISWWRNELNNMFNGVPQHPLARALVPVIREYDLPREQFMELIDGRQMDLDTRRYETFADLGLYLYRSAGVLHQLASEISGYTERRTAKHAQALGSALLLIDIICDVHAAAHRDHIYLPLDELQRFDVTEAQILNSQHSDRFVALMEFQVQRAREHLQRAVRLLPEADRYTQRGGLMLAEIYLATLDELAADGFRVLQHRLSLTPLRKFWIAWRTHRRERKRYKRQL